MGLAAAGVMVAGATYQAVAQYEAGQRNKNANDMMAQDAVARGQLPESVARMRGTQAISAGRSAAASAGVDVQSGSVVAVGAGTRGMSALDAATIRGNALREAYGYKLRGEEAAAEGTSAAIGTLIGGAGMAGSAAYQSGAFNGGGDSPPTQSWFDDGAMPKFGRG